MTLEKAIQLLQDALKDQWCPWSQDLKDAIKLTTEATKRFKALRELIRVPLTDPLPGEDPE